MRWEWWIYLNVVSSLWLEYPLELRTWRFAKPCPLDLPDFRDGYDGFDFLDKLDGEFSDDDDVSSCWSVRK